MASLWLLDAVGHTLVFRDVAVDRVAQREERALLAGRPAGWECFAAAREAGVKGSVTHFDVELVM